MDSLFSGLVPPQGTDHHDQYPTIRSKRLEYHGETLILNRKNEVNSFCPSDEFPDDRADSKQNWGYSWLAEVRAGAGILHWQIILPSCYLVQNFGPSNDTTTPFCYFLFVTGAFCKHFYVADPTSVTNPILDYLSKWSPLLLLLLGGLLTQLWNRFRTRTRRFTWKAWHSQIAVAANNPQLGTVTVQHNGTPVNHVHTTTVEFLNDSNEDQKNVLVTLAFPGGGHIISSNGFIQGTLSPIPFDPGYVAQYTGANAAQINVLSTYVVHKILVFNRRQKATFTLLVRDDPNSQVIASCNHPGVKLEFLP